MKSIFITCIALIILSTQAICQVKFGVKAGMNLANVKNLGPGGTTTKASAYGGFFIKLPTVKNLSLQPEILYSSKGYLFPKTDSTAKGRVTINYISIPLLVTYKVLNNLLIMVGPELNYITNAKLKSGNRNNDISANFRKFDIALDFGTAYNLKNGLGIEFRYCYGFDGIANVVQTDQLGNYIGTKKQGSNQVIQLGIFYIFPKF